MAKTLNFGDYDPEIHGNMYDYCQNLLRKLHTKTGAKDTLLTLTPICEYQINQEWPEPPFVNINTYGSKSTQKENWLGYIPIDFSEIDFEQLIEDNGILNVHSHIKRTQGSYGIFLNVSDEYKMLEIYAQMDHKQIQAATYLAHKTSAYYLIVDPVLTPDGKHYDFLLKGHCIANVSSKKINAWLGDSEITKARLRIHKFRQTEYDPGHYTSVTLTKRIIV